MSETIREAELNTFNPFSATPTSSQQSNERLTESDVASRAVPTEISRSKASSITLLLTDVSLLDTIGSGIQTVALPTNLPGDHIRHSRSILKVNPMTCQAKQSKIYTCQTPKPKGNIFLPVPNLSLVHHQCPPLAPRPTMPCLNMGENPFNSSQSSTIIESRPEEMTASLPLSTISVS
ncbi:MAG: hypothetical protein Q9175_002979 [Cornicularia normoerica]